MRNIIATNFVSVAAAVNFAIIPTVLFCECLLYCVCVCIYYDESMPNLWYLRIRILPTNHVIPRMTVETCCRVQTPLYLVLSIKYPQK